VAPGAVEEAVVVALGAIEGAERGGRARGCWNCELFLARDMPLTIRGGVVLGVMLRGVAYVDVGP
jgi:hypothetical protein